ncbi:MAG: FtsQ-type POTRA domain-containing protein [Chloroflexi bacterium]|nr:FtsQ-type POTRA domain-containing protein [Chloroflexota bacterium]
MDRPRTIYRAEAQPKPRSRRARKVLTAASLTLLLGSVIAAGEYAFQSSLLRVRHVTIAGASVPIATSVADLLVPGCAGDQPQAVTCPPGMEGANELLVSPHELEREIQLMPAVKSAHVTARLPDRLAVTIQERTPEAAWVAGPDVFRVAGDGMVIDRGSPDGLKVIIGQVAGDPVKPGDTVDPNVIKGAEQLQSQLAGQNGFATQRIQYSPADGLAVIGDNGLIAMFGSSADLGLKTAELERIVQLAQDKKSPLTFVDLRYKTPYFRTS